VIRSLNDDMPYDLFVKAQIAGDLFERRSPEADSRPRVFMRWGRAKTTGWT
jgi:hypothetical protein